jgi:hypothetical protein
MILNVSISCYLFPSQPQIPTILGFFNCKNLEKELNIHAFELYQNFGNVSGGKNIERKNVSKVLPQFN